MRKVQDSGHFNRQSVGWFVNHFLMQRITQKRLNTQREPFCFSSPDSPPVVSQSPIRKVRSRRWQEV